MVKFWNLVVGLLSCSQSDLCQSITPVTVTQGLTLIPHFQAAISSYEYFRLDHLFISSALSTLYTYYQYRLELFLLLQHDHLHGKLPRELLPQNRPFQNPWQSHLQCPSPHANWTKNKRFFCPLQPRRCHSLSFCSSYDKHQVRHSVTC